MYFDGNPRRKAFISLGASNKRQSSIELLYKNKRERDMREVQRLKNEKAILIQSYVRSWLTRIKYDRILREKHDILSEDTTSLNERLESIWCLLKCYRSNLDNMRVVKLSQWLLSHTRDVARYSHQSKPYYLKWSLRLCCSCLLHYEATKSAIPLRVLESNLSPSLANYLAPHRLFNAIVNILILKSPTPDDKKPSNYSHMAESLLSIILTCLKSTPDSIPAHQQGCALHNSFITTVLLSANQPHLGYYLIPCVGPLLDIEAIYSILTCLLTYLQLVGSNSIWLMYSLLCLLTPHTAHSAKINMLGLAVITKLLPNIITQPHRCNKHSGSLFEQQYTSDTDSDSEHDDTSDGCCDLILSEEGVRKFIIHSFTCHKSSCSCLSMTIPDGSYNFLSQLIFEFGVHQFVDIKTLSFFQILSKSPVLIRKLWAELLQIELRLLNSTPKRAFPMLCSNILPLPISIVNQLLHLTYVSCASFSYFLEQNYDQNFFIEQEPFSIPQLLEMIELLRELHITLLFNSEKISTPALTSDWLKVKEVVRQLLRNLWQLDDRCHFVSPRVWVSPRMLLNTNIKFQLLFPQHADSDDESASLIIPSQVKLHDRWREVLHYTPFTIHFLSRVKIFHLMVNQLREQNQVDSFMGGLPIKVHRSHMYENAFEQLSAQPNMRRRIQVQLINEQGIEEAGIDGGGLFREFLTEVLKKGFHPYLAFFSTTEEQTLYPNPSVYLLKSDADMHYHFLGRLLGRLLYDKLLADLSLSKVFLARVLSIRHDSRIDKQYLSQLDPDMARSLFSLKSLPQGEINELCLTFEKTSDAYGHCSSEELIPGGKDIAVTINNVDQYMDLMADSILNKSTLNSCCRFRDGLDSVIPLPWIRMFSPTELRILLSGVPDPVNIQDLKNNTTYLGGYTADSECIRLLWEVLIEITEIQKKLFLKFVTSCSQPPLLGFKDLEPKMGILRSREHTDHLPTSSTCMNLLKLPEFTDKETLKRKLLKAIESNAGFEMS